MTHRPRGDEGYRVGMAVTMLGVAAGALAARAHEDGMASLQRHLAFRRQAVEDAMQALKEQNAEKLEVLARSLADEVLRLRGEADQLRKLLEQRQAVIDTLSKR